MEYQGKTIRKKIWGLVVLGFVLAMLFGMNVFAASAPTGLRQTYAYTSSVEVAWNPVSGTNVYYQVEKSFDNKTWSVESSSTSSTKRFISGCASGSTVYVRVRAKEGYNGTLGPVSAAFAAVTQPESVTKVTQTNATTSAVTLSWPAAKGAMRYRIYEYENGKRGAQKAVVTGTSATITRLSADSRYRFEVVSERSTTNFVKTGYSTSCTAYTVAGAIKGMQVTDAYRSQNSLVLRWTRLNYADGIEIQVYNHSGKKKVGKVQKPSGGTSTICTVKGIKANAFYQIKARSYVSTASGKKYSSWATIYSANQQKLKLGATNKGIQVSWKKVSGAKDYTVYGRKGASSNKSSFKKIKTVKGTKLVVSKIGSKKVKRGDSYYFYVVANKKVGKKTWKSAVSYSDGKYYSKYSN